MKAKADKRPHKYSYRENIAECLFGGVRRELQGRMTKADKRPHKYSYEENIAEYLFGGVRRELQGKLTVPLQPYFEKWAAALARKKVEDAADAHTGARSHAQDCGIPPYYVASPLLSGCAYTSMQDPMKTQFWQGRCGVSLLEDGEYVAEASRNAARWGFYVAWGTRAPPCVSCRRVNKAIAQWTRCPADLQAEAACRG